MITGRKSSLSQFHIFHSQMLITTNRTGKFFRKGQNCRKILKYLRPFWINFYFEWKAEFCWRHSKQLVSWLVLVLCIISKWRLYFYYLKKKRKNFNPKLFLELFSVSFHCWAFLYTLICKLTDRFFAKAFEWKKKKIIFPLIHIYIKLYIHSKHSMNQNRFFLHWISIFYVQFS